MDGREWGMKYWLDRQVDQIIDKASWWRFETDKTEDRVTIYEKQLLSRLASCVPLMGESYIRELQERVSASAFQSMVVEETLDQGALMIEDGLGQAESSDLDSAALSTQLVFRCAVDGLLASKGEFDRTLKWRAKDEGRSPAGTGVRGLLGRRDDA